MTRQYPTNLNDLKNIIGVGEGKAKKYGNEFIEKIKQHIDDNEIVKTEDYVIKSQPKKNDLKIFIIKSADRKLLFDEIIEQKKITMETLINEIESIVNSGTKINIDYHLDEILDDSQQEEIYTYFINEAENDSIQEAITYFDEEYDENPNSDRLNSNQLVSVIFGISPKRTRGNSKNGPSNSKESKEFDKDIVSSETFELYVAF